MSLRTFRAIHEDRTVEVHKFPQELKDTNDSTGVAIKLLLDKFKTLTKVAGMIPKKLKDNQQIATIDSPYSDVEQEFDSYLLRSRQPKEQSVKEITNRKTNYVK
ncbi:hypothetical protein [Staphylococcus phage vB_SauH_DELF3]|nr:hypothetical protein [Staphylococcus phage vB_SauH_DELF3]